MSKMKKAFPVLRQSMNASIQKIVKMRIGECSGRSRRDGLRWVRGSMA
jgi:hypothetical protein